MIFIISPRGLGIEDAESMLLPSPFDYTRQALLCVPRNLPQTNQPGAARQLASMLRPIIEANNGRCFMLCTSHAMMRDLAEQFRATMTLPVLLQGETSKGQLLQQFVSAGNALTGCHQQLLGRGGRAWRYVVAGDY